MTAIKRFFLAIWSHAALRFSLLLHLMLVLLVTFGIPNFFPPTQLVDNSAITVEVLTVREFTNLQLKKKTPPPKPKKKREVITKNQPKIALPEPASKPEISKPEPAPKPEITPKVEPKPKEAPPPPPKPKAKPKEEEKIKPVKKEPPKIKEDAFASVLKSVEEFRQNPEETKEETPEIDFSEIEDFLSSVKDEQRYKPGLPLSISEKDAIKQQIIRNWTVLSGVKDAATMVVVLEISLAIDGSVTDVAIVDTIRYSIDSAFRAMTDSAIRGVYKSSPLQHLPPEKYDVKDGWREIELRFDPSEMMY
jgi:hypothetical protein